MITFNEACNLALKYYKEELGINGIYQPYDIGHAWVFNGGRKDELRVGIQKIAIAKEGGAVTPFNLPSQKNFALLDAGIALELPEEYR